MSSTTPTLTKLTNMISRYTQSYTNVVLKKYGLGNGTYPFILTLAVKEGINQNQISKELNVDKAMSARAIRHLVELGYIKKEEDLEDSRAFRLFLTDKARTIIPAVKDELLKWNKDITKGISQEEGKNLLDLLGKVLDNAKKYKNLR